MTTIPRPWLRARPAAKPTALAAERAPAPPRSIRTKIDAIIRSALITLVLLSVTGLGAIGVLTVVLVQLTHDVGPAERANMTVRQRMTDSETSLRAYQLTRDPIFLQTWQNAQQPLQEALATLRTKVGDEPGVADLVARQETLVTQWLRYTAPIASNPAALTDAPSQATAKSYFDAFRGGNAQVGVWLANDRETLTTVALVVAALSAAAFIAVVVHGATRGLRPARRARSGVAPPLEDLHRVVTRLHDGDRSARADPHAGVLEIRAVAEAVNDLAELQQRSEQRIADELRLTAFERDWAVGLHSLDGLPQLLAERAAALAGAMGASAVFVRTLDNEGEDGLTIIHPPMPVEQRAPSTLVRAVFEVAQLCWRLQEPLTFYASTAKQAPDTNRQVLTTDRLVPVALQHRMLDYVATLGADSILFAAFGAADRPLGYVGLVRPVGSPVWADTELTAIQRMARDVGRAVALERAYRREQRLVSELQALDTQKNAFVSMISHELRTPLASISGHLEIVRAGDLGVIEPLVDRSLEAIERNARRLTTLIGDLLLLSRIEEGERPVTMVPVDLGPVIEECAATLRHQAQRAGVAFDLVLPDRPAPTLGDPQEIERVFDNLISNAVKFSPSGSRVRIGLEVTETDAVITVTDHGLGISVEDQGALFTRFFRSTNPAALNIPGTGLGLAISKIIVERHRGRIAVDSALGRGTTMTVTLPLRLPAAVGAAR
ncbi:signal transduction histidine kinase [Friedmanniella endophytica]|uniref:histidine kinase n=1 Tax=Microlunatus kandeliicorticis TaxID=1759536 RepID=A0A7W3IT65_9ACTN|nr:ATP-binding protein [Microlunatus kandeliicorticis]MBA8794812.1 signal transduction histidine kinase [Microlunatus kandeliicorticis]